MLFRSPNVIPDRASAEVMIRLVGDSTALRKKVAAALGDGVATRIVLEVPPVRLGTIPGIETTVVKFTTDIPELTGWGEPFLLGPGSVHVAHTAEERVAKKDLVEAVDLYQKMVKELQARCDGNPY